MESSHTKFDYSALSVIMIIAIIGPRDGMGEWVVGQTRCGEGGMQGQARLLAKKIAACMSLSRGAFGAS